MFGIWQFRLLGYLNCIHSIHYMKWDTGIQSHRLLICPNQTPISTKCPKLSLNARGQRKCEGGESSIFAFLVGRPELGDKYLFRTETLRIKCFVIISHFRSLREPEKRIWILRFVTSGDNLARICLCCWSIVHWMQRIWPVLTKDHVNSTHAF